MRFSPTFLDELRNRLAVSDVVGRRVKLKKQGREWRGLSPFNTEKTPSFYVNDQKMAWFDFSSGRNGNIFDFVMATEGVSFPEAVERLAGEAGLALPSRSADDVVQEGKRAGLIDACEWAAQYFQSALQGREGGRARTYLTERGLGSDVQAEFRLGFSLREKFALRDHLAGRGVGPDVMIEAGLLVHGEGIAVPYDRFRDRVMFPIQDRNGRVIAFGGRALDKDVPAKYLNSPETPLFHKGGILYNHHRARKPASDKGTVVAVEGYIDVIAMTMAGVPNVVAPLGTALTGDQCEVMWRMAPEPLLCFDGDAAGRRAAFKAVDTVLPLIAPGRSLRFAFLPEGQDPDDLARSGGAGAIETVLDQAKPLVDVLWLRETDHLVLDTPERRAGLERRLGDLVHEIKDEALRRHYGSELQARLRQVIDAGRRGAGGTRGPADKRAPWRPGRPRGGPEPLRGYVASPLNLNPGTSLARAVMPPRETLIAALILNHPALLEWHAEDLAHTEFTNADVARLRDGLLQCLGDHPRDHDALRDALIANGHGGLREKIMAAAERLPHWCLKPETADVDADQVLRQALALHRKAGTLHRDLKAAEHALGRDASDQNFAALQDVQARLSALEGTEASVEGFGASSGREATDV
ncbi:DNA primase [Lichenihabitans psoromatis]|uniref:DNA primase n=1 Tax=Lichenihabitans psoromatis TaxID=2528642 RepID=UPI00103859C0|nr:DNA primase [Lichenihabitans psoromatis]